MHTFCKSFPALCRREQRLPSLAVIACMLAGVAAGCSSVPLTAPVESRNIAKSGPAPQKSASALKVPDGFYRVRKGDTIIGVALDHGVSWRDVVAWNQLENPNVIEEDQLLRVKPPVSGARAPAAVAKGSDKTDIKPIPPSAPKSSSAAPVQPPAANAMPPADGAGPATSAPAVADGIALSWPSQGKVIQQFADPGYKGIAISGAEGDPILAAGDGRVVYSGSGLRGYGNLVIVKHDGDFLTAYAHNKSILVAEGQAVKRGQKIAELGKSDSDVPKLHFEVRRSGKPVDPMKYLAQR